MEEPIYLDDTVQSAQCHLSAWDTAPLPGFREKGRKGSLREHLREGGRCVDQQVPIGRLLYAKPCAQCRCGERGGSSCRFTLSAEG